MREGVSRRTLEAMSPDHPTPEDSDSPDDSDGTARTRGPGARLLVRARRLLTLLSATLRTGDRPGSPLRRVRPRTRAVQLGTAALAVGVLSVLVGGTEPAPHRPSVELATARGPASTTAAPDHQRPVERWARQVSGETGTPPEALHAYVEAARTVHERHPHCELPWTVLAGIGGAESDHARFGGATVLDSGRPSEEIVGVALNGSGVRSIGDTDGGRLDGDPVHDRAVGPMQFIPSTWQSWATDGNGDGTTDPQNLYDSAATAGNYLCGSAGGDALADTAGQRQALLTYNRSAAYGDEVLDHARRYADAPAPPAAPGSTATSR